MFFLQMDRARVYHAKLINIKKEMLNLHEKTVQLKVLDDKFFALHNKFSIVFELTDYMI
jgi:hypothetical protein